MESETPKDCPSCNVAPVIKTDHKDRSNPVYVACSNELDCPVWPIGLNASSEQAAIQNWNADRLI